MAATPPCVLRDDDGQIVSPLEAHLVPHGDSFRKAYMEEWEQGAHASEYSGQESEYRWKDHNSWPSWDTQVLSVKEIFARLTHESSDESESIFGPYWAPQPPNSECTPSLTFKHTDDGWDASRESLPVLPGLPSTPQSSWHPHPDANASRSSWAFTRCDMQLSARLAGTPLAIEPLDPPAPSERVVSGVTHPVQHGMIPRNPLWL